MKPPYSAKITIPFSDEILLRTRLFDKLDQGRRKPVLWISAPAGSGKTTLVSSYVAARGFPCLWYQVDDGDHDLATFFYYLGLAGKKSAPRRRKSLPLLTPEYLPGIAEFSRKFFTEIFDRLQSPALLVFDNYQEVSDDSHLHAVLLEGLSRLPPGINIILISRRAPPSAYSRLMANRQMEQLGWADLRFTLEEFEQTAVNLLDKAPAEAMIGLMYEKMDGWIAGLYLVLESHGQVKFDLNDSDFESPEGVFNYFASESFNRLKPGLKDFLVKTAYLPSMTSAMAGDLSADKRASRILSHLHRNNYFTYKHIQQSAVYQYHPLFREFLLEQASFSLAERECVLLQRKGARLLMEAGRYEEAVELLDQAGDVEGIASLIMGRAECLLKQGRHQVLQDWLSRLPDEMLAANPWLLFWQGMSRFSLAPRTARPFFEKAFELFKKAKVPEGIFLSWVGVVDTYILGWKEIQPLDQWIAELGDLMGEYPEFPSPEIESRVSGSMFSALRFRRPDHPDMGLWETRLQGAIEKSRDIAKKILSLGELSHYYIWVGEYAKAKSALDRTRHLAAAQDLPPFLEILMYAFEANYYWLTAQFEECRSCVQRGLKASLESGIHAWDDLVLVFGVYEALSRQDLDTASQYLDKMALQLSHNPMADSSRYDYAASWHALLRNDLSQAAEHLEIALARLKDVGFFSQQLFVRSAMAWCFSKEATTRRPGNTLARLRIWGSACGAGFLSSIACWPNRILPLQSRKKRRGKRT